MNNNKINDRQVNFFFDNQTFCFSLQKRVPVAGYPCDCLSLKIANLKT